MNRKVKMRKHMKPNEGTESFVYNKREQKKSKREKKARKNEIMFDGKMSCKTFSCVLSVSTKNQRRTMNEMRFGFELCFG